MERELLSCRPRMKLSCPSSSPHLLFNAYKYGGGDGGEGRVLVTLVWSRPLKLLWAKEIEIPHQTIILLRLKRTIEGRRHIVGDLKSRRACLHFHVIL